MENKCLNQIDNFLLSSKTDSLSFINFQIVYQFRGEKKFIKSINFLFGNKILKKVYLKELLVSDEKTNIESIIIEMLLKDIGKQECKPKISSNHYSTDQDARIQAATNLFTNLGI